MRVVLTMEHFETSTLSSVFDITKKLVAKSSANPLARGKTAELKASEEINSLKEENRVVSEILFCAYGNTNLNVVLILQLICVCLVSVDGGDGCYATSG